MSGAFKLACSCVCLLASVAGARADILTFRGTAIATCALALPIDGVVSLNGDLKSWSTTTPASITAINTSSATLTVTKPTTWATSPAGTPATTFTTTGTLTGTNSGNLTGSGASQTGALTNIGTTILAVSLGATSTAPFKSGLHTAEVTVTCSVP